MNTINLFFIWVVVALIVAAIGGVIIMLLWNWLMPSIFDLPEINFLQAFGLRFLATVLFGNVTVNKKSD